MKRALLLTGLLIFMLTPYAQAKHLHPEAEYQQAWCSYHKGNMEVEQNDFTRVDCLTDNVNRNIVPFTGFRQKTGYSSAIN